MTEHTTPEIKKLITALNSAIQSSPDATRLGIRPVAGGITNEFDAWQIPLASGPLPVTGRELYNLIDDLREATEKATSLDVTLFIDPFNGESRSTTARSA